MNIIPIREYCNSINIIPIHKYFSKYSLISYSYIESAINMVNVAEKSFREHTTLEKLVLIEYPPRADSVHLAELSQYSNQTLRAAVDKSKFRRQIVVGSMDNLKHSSLEEMVDRFGPRNVHPLGMMAYISGAARANKSTPTALWPQLKLLQASLLLNQLKTSSECPGTQ